MWRDDYHLWLYTYLAKKYFNIRVDAVDLEEAVVGEVRGAKRDKSFLQSVCCKIKKIFIESPLRTMKRAISYYYRIFCHNKSEVLYYGLDVSVDTTINWIARSFGTIQPLYYPSRQIDAPRSSELREELTSALRGLEIISPIVADVIGRTLPKLYLEEYKYHHVSSLSFLRAHKRLKLIFFYYRDTVSLQRNNILLFGTKTRGENHRAPAWGGTMKSLMEYLIKKNT